MSQASQMTTWEALTLMPESLASERRRPFPRGPLVRRPWLQLAFLSSQHDLG